MADKKWLACPSCGAQVAFYKNPFPTVDLIIEAEAASGITGIVLIKRAREPRAWALPGGFVDYGESLEEAAVREGKEETNLEIDLVRQFHTYSDPRRDPRQHNISTVFIARGKGILRAGSDAEAAGVFTEKNLPRPLAFDHDLIVNDYFSGNY